MKQFILPQAPDPSGLILLSGKDYHYLIHVRRYEVGTLLAVLVPGDSKASQSHGQLRIIEIYPDHLVGEVTCESAPQNGEAFSSPFPSPRIRLFFGYPKGKKIDAVIRQATELGVSEIQPVLCDRSIPDPDKAGWGKKQVRYERIISEAVQQSGAPQVPVLSIPETLDQLLGGLKGSVHPGEAGITRDVGLFFHETRLAKEGLHDYLCPLPDRLSVFIGPEGGISPRERNLLEQHHWKPGYLGFGVLRCETAVVAAVSAVKAICGEDDRWQIKEN
jgi:16S rRNA (uracil1498-N3)-methyltransferase